MSMIFAARLRYLIFQAYLSLLLKQRSKAAKINNIKRVSIHSSNEISLIWSNNANS